MSTLLSLLLLTTTMVGIISANNLNPYSSDETGRDTHSNNIYHKNNGNRDISLQVLPVQPILRKKNVFISRGWGASGMPLSTADTADGGMDENSIDSSQNNKPKSKFMRLLLNSNYHHRQGQRNYSIPQLFVSYGWGPMG